MKAILENEDQVVDQTADQNVEKTAGAAKGEPDYRHHFTEPFNWNGKVYTELDFNFGKLTGEDAIAIYDELQAKGITVISPKFSPHYQMCLASRACGLGSDAFRAMSYKDFEMIIGKTKGFIPTVALL